MVGRRLLQRALGVTVGVALGLLGAEGLLRAAWDPRSPGVPGELLQASDRWLEGEDAELQLPFAYDRDLGWIVRPGLEDYEYAGAPISTNSFGMRGRREPTVERTPGLRRILMSGDSFAFGEEQSDELAWPAQIEDRLDDVELFNFAAPGYGSDQSYLRLCRELPRWKPDLVVWFVFVDDVTRATRRVTFYAKPRPVLKGGELVIEGQPVPSPSEYRADPTLGLAEPPSALRVADVLGGLLAAARGDVARGEGIRAYGDYDAVHRAMARDLAERCREQGAELLVVWLPNRSWARAEPISTELGFEEWAEEFGYSFLNLTDGYRGLEIPEGRHLFRQNGGHFTGFGAVKTARLIGTRIDALLSEL